MYYSWQKSFRTRNGLLKTLETLEICDNISYLGSVIGNGGNNEHMKGLEAKGPFSCLGLQLRIKRAYQTPINFSLLWLVKHHLNNSNYYLNIIFKS